MKKQNEFILVLVAMFVVIIAGVLFLVYTPSAIINGNIATTTDQTYMDVVTNRVGPADIYPNSTVTPGVINASITQDNISQNICNPNWSTKSERPSSAYTTGLKKYQLGLAKSFTLADVTPQNISPGQYINIDTNTADYEEDHLISLELGGNPTDPANLWPEPYTASIPDGGAKNKDAVENYLHKRVCAGQITLAQAQFEIAYDWYGLYVNNIKGKLGATSASDQNDN